MFLLYSCNLLTSEKLTVTEKPIQELRVLFDSSQTKIIINLDSLARQSIDYIKYLKQENLRLKILSDSLGNHIFLMEENNRYFFDTVLVLTQEKIDSVLLLKEN